MKQVTSTFPTGQYFHMMHDEESLHLSSLHAHCFTDILSVKASTLSDSKAPPPPY